MFLEPRAGTVDTTLYNRRGVDTYKYFYRWGLLCVWSASPRHRGCLRTYRTAEEVREGMQRALAKHEHGVEL
jgi:hypothetical protein